MDMPSFQHITPPMRIYSGADSLGQLSRELSRLGSQRAVIFCGGSLAREGKLLERIQAAMGDRCAGVYAGVRAHSPVPAVQAAAEELQRLKADAVIAVGGGSAIVTARAAAILAAENKHPRDICTVIEGGSVRSPKLNAPKLPQIVIPTTPTTASVKAGTAVFDPEAGKRLALFDPKTRAQSVFIDPQMIQSAPRELVTTASINTMAMAIEGLVSRTGDPLADAQLIHALRLIAQYLPGLPQRDDDEARGNLMLAAILCGHGTDHTSAGVTTVLGHAIGARYDTENGTVNAVVLPHVLRFNGETAAAGLAKVAAGLGLPRAGAASQVAAVADAVQTIFSALGVPRQLRDVGVQRDALPAIATLAMGDWFLAGNPRKVQNAAELQQVMEQAW